jgi:hypothetical protein
MRRGLVAGHQMRRGAPAGLILEIDVGERVAVGVAGDVALPIQLWVSSSTDQDGGKRRGDTSAQATFNPRKRSCSTALARASASFSAYTAICADSPQNS